MTEYERGAFDVFDLITSAWYGKQYYFPQDVHKDNIVYSRESGKYMPFEDALDEFLSKIGDDVGFTG